MSFWSVSTGENLAAQTKEQREEYTPATGDLEPIPAGSKVRAFVKEAKWDKNPDGDRYIKLRWDVVKPEEVAKRVIFQKLWVKDDDLNAKNPGDKRDKALRMLAKIDSFAGGKLAAKGAEPTDDDLAIALQDKQMVICVEIWEMEGRDGEQMSGNWVRDVKPCEGTALAVGKAKEKPAAPDIDDDIPF